jgi:hypothetical protein
MQLFKKLNTVDYICMYNVYKLLYKKTHFQFICNYNTTNWFFNVTIYLLIHYIFKGIVA